MPLSKVVSSRGKFIDQIMSVSQIDLECQHENRFWLFMEYMKKH